RPVVQDDRSSCSALRADLLVRIVREAASRRGHSAAKTRPRSSLLRPSVVRRVPRRKRPAPKCRGVSQLISFLEFAAVHQPAGIPALLGSCCACAVSLEFLVVRVHHLRRSRVARRKSPLCQTTSPRRHYVLETE